MVLTKKVLRIIGDEDHLRCRNKLALALGKSQYTIQRYIQDNNDELTKAAALEIIREETGLNDDEILIKQDA